MNDQGRHLTGLLFRATVSVSILAYLAQKMEWALLLDLAGSVEPCRLLLAFGVLGVAFGAAALRWYFLLQIQSIHLPLGAVCKLTLIGAFFNAFLLGSTGGDVAKLVYVFRQYPHNKANAALSVIIDRVLGLAALLLLALVFMAFKLQAFLALPQMRMLVITIVICLLLLVCAGVLMLILPLLKLPLISQKLWQKIPGHELALTFFQGYQQHWRQGKKLALATASSAVVQLLIFWSAFLLAQAIGMSVGFIDLVIIVASVTCIVSLPVSMGGHGLREGAFLLMFTVLSEGNAIPVAREMVILFSLLYFLLGIGWSMVGGIIYLFFSPLKT